MSEQTALDLDRAVRPIEELLDALIDDERCHAREAHSDYRSDRRVSEYDADRKKSRAALLDAIRAALVERQTDAERYRFLRDNPLGLRAIDGNASPRSFTAEGFDWRTDRARSAVVGVEGGQDG